MSVIQASIPLFFLLIGIELFVARVRGSRAYRLNDSVADLSLGILSQIADIGIKLATLGIYAWVAAHWSTQRLGTPGWIDRSPFTEGGPLGVGIDAAERLRADGPNALPVVPTPGWIGRFRAQLLCLRVGDRRLLLSEVAAVLCRRHDATRSARLDLR